MTNYEYDPMIPPSATGFNGEVRLRFFASDEKDEMIAITISSGEALQFCAALATAARQAIKDVL